VARCSVCGKGTIHGRNIRHRHAGRWERRAPKTNRVFRANVHKRIVDVNGEPIRMAICTRCLRTQLKVTG
jgi:large subunit ribosomal protein L28